MLLLSKYYFKRLINFFYYKILQILFFFRKICFSLPSFSAPPLTHTLSLSLTPIKLLSYRITHRNMLLYPCDVFIKILIIIIIIIFNSYRSSVRFRNERLKYPPAHIRTHTYIHTHTHYIYIFFLI